MSRESKIKIIIRETLKEVSTSDYSSAVNREIRASIEKSKESGDDIDDTEEEIYTDPSKGVVSPSSLVKSNVCKREGICNEQGPITFGQLERLIKTAQKKNLGLNIGEGIYKSMIRLLPWFIPQIAIGAFVGSGIRAINKVVKPALETTKGYKSWWGKSVLNVMRLAEGELSIDDPLGKIFFISDGLLDMLDEKWKLKFARYISELAASKPETEIVPDYFVENELRKWINQKFLLDPKLPIKESVTLNEGVKEVVLTLGLLLGGQMALSQTQADSLINNPTKETKEQISNIVKNKPLLKSYIKKANEYGDIKKPSMVYVDGWLRLNKVDFKIDPNKRRTMVSVRFPLGAN
jgi:hypothetical protein